MSITSGILKAAQKQASATSLVLKETQNQTEQSLMPILVLTLQGDQGVFFVKNVGKGPALNISTQPFLENNSPNPMFHYRDALGIAEQDELIVRIGSKGQLLQHQDFKNLVMKAGPDKQFHTKMSYQGVNRCRYETSHTIKQTAGKFDFIIQFDGFSRVDGPPVEGTINT